MKWIWDDGYERVMDVSSNFRGTIHAGKRPAKIEMDSTDLQNLILYEINDPGMLKSLLIHIRRVLKVSE